MSAGYESQKQGARAGGACRAASTEGVWILRAGRLQQGLLQGLWRARCARCREGRRRGVRSCRPLKARPEVRHHGRQARQKGAEGVGEEGHCRRVNVSVQQRG